MYGMQLGTVRISGNSLRALTSYEITWAAAQSFSTSSPHRILILFFPLASTLFLQLYVSCWRRRHLSLITYSSHTKGRSETSHRLLIQIYYILLSKNIQLYYKHQRYIIHVEESLLHEVAPQDHRSRDIYRFGSS